MGSSRGEVVSLVAVVRVYERSPKRDDEVATS